MEMSTHLMGQKKALGVHINSLMKRIDLNEKLPKVRDESRNSVKLTSRT
jgi:hypothetical protein